MGLLLVMWGMPLGAALMWYVETGQVAPIAFTLGTIVWFTIWGLALGDKS